MGGLRRVLPAGPSRGVRGSERKQQIFGGGRWRVVRTGTPLEGSVGCGSSCEQLVGGAVQRSIESSRPQAPRFPSEVKVRRTRVGVHFFDVATGLNVLLDEVSVDPQDWDQAPRQVSVALTNSCDLACPYCYAPKLKARLDATRVVGWMRELDDNGCLSVGFGGGEPTLFPGFPSLCSGVASQTGLAVTFTTHGHRLTAGLCDELRGSVQFVRVSMDGVGATYERLRGRPFAILLERLANVRRIAPFGINFVVNSETIDDLDDAVELAVKVGASEFLLLPEQPTVQRAGIDEATSTRLREWVRDNDPALRLTVSTAGADGLPVCVPLTGELPSEAYAHVDAQGVLKWSSYGSEGVTLDDDGLMAALHKLRERGGMA
ncbi:radical SAM protein [Micromonospora parva]|uniref:radical SAM protein n=1 Tax=Micromonospora parva TaxID=1464048 RepID=UPI00379987F6